MRRASLLGSDCGKCAYELNGLLLFYRVFDVERERSVLSDTAMTYS